ncbi:MAG: hypothetical protein O7A66_06900 [Alphaproteobacteria bacterium]|nr:hypothetical protein [Alphaproteobacteria bacterium]
MPMSRGRPLLPAVLLAMAASIPVPGAAPALAGTIFRAGKVLISRQTSNPRFRAVGAMLTADCEFTAD